MAFPVWLQAGFWGLVGGSALLLGACLGYFLKIPQRVIAAIMAFGAGVLISALSYKLLPAAHAEQGVFSSPKTTSLQEQCSPGPPGWFIAAAARLAMFIAPFKSASPDQLQ